MPPAARFSLSVTAKTTAKSAWAPFVMKCFRPFSTHSPPSSTAVVRMAWASDPASGSVRAKHMVFSARTRGGTYLSRRCSGRAMRIGVGASGFGGPRAKPANRIPVLAPSSTNRV